MRRSSLLLLGFALLGGCTEPANTTGTMYPQDAAAAIKGAASVSENTDLATLHAATARFHRYEAVAKDAGYTFLFMNMCMVDQSPDKAGGMGYHYVNTDLLDGKVEVDKPEALLYEPEANGQLRLVAVEYVIPKDAWTADTLPRLFGQQLKLNAFNLYALHVWAWENNPSGIYANWNPRVNCDNAI
ncbi:MAG: hypothetical protein ACJ79A_11935 [Gemmatimonadaceae bacterium]